MELKPGEKPSELQAIPRQKHGITKSALSAYLKAPYTVLNQHMRALGIHLEPFMRDDKYITKQYKRNTRPLTDDEARRIIERHRALQGRDED